MKTLVINTGSSSIKYQLFEMPEGTVHCSGLVEQIGEGGGRIKHKNFIGSDIEEFVENRNFHNHEEGMNRMAALLTDEEYGVIAHTSEVEVVGHRVVHGGEEFAKTTIIDESVKQTIDRLSTLAPLHNPPNLIGIKMAEKVFAKAKQIGVFDTAFHQSIPPVAFRYAIPYELYKEHGVRVYGFHGTSHRYITKQTAKLLDKPQDELNMISIHLGNGASMTAIKNGQSIDTTLGMTPLPGLVMGTRSGDIDPAIIFYLNEQVGMSMPEIKTLLNKESGMKGLAGNNDLRAVVEASEQGDKDALLALNIYAYRIKKYIGAYIAAIGKIDAIVFTAGVGENSILVRKLSTENLQHLGIELDPAKNAAIPNDKIISTSESPVKIMVIPTNEEYEIANQAYTVYSEQQ